jgi:CHAD domain-containing protein
MRASEATVSAIVQRAITQSYERLIAHESDLRISDDPESVHQARVATRRLRSDLQTFSALVDPEWATDLRAELRWLGAELGAVRDLEVRRDRLREHAGQLPTAEAEAARRVVRRLDADRAAARSDLVATLTQARFAHLRVKLGDAAAHPAITDAGRACGSAELTRVVRKRWRKLRRAVRQLGDHPSDEALHLVRVRAKQCRYAAEACEPAFGKRARRLARAMTKVQDLLGEHHDAVTAGAWLTKTAHECSPAEAYAIGMLAQIERGAAAEARAAFPALWRRIDTDRVRGWL